MSEQLQKLASGIPLEGWEAIKSVPGVLETVTDAAGIVFKKTSDVDELFDQLQALSEPSAAAIFILSALCLVEELRSKTLGVLSVVCRKVGEVYDASMIFQFINCPVFARRSDGLSFVLAARLLSLIQDLVYDNTQFILNGLNCQDATARKQALFILKQIVAKAKPGDKSVLYCSSLDWQGSWNLFFLLYDTFQEPQSHLLEPLFPLLSSFMVEDSRCSLGMSWWESIVRRGLENTSVAVRKRLLEHIIIEIPIEQYPCLQQADDFVFGKLLDLVDNSYLYSAIDFNRLVSPFGLSVTKFYVKFFGLAKNDQDRRARLLKFFGRLDSLKSNMAIVFLLNALLESLPIDDLIQQNQLSILLHLAEHRGFHNHKARSMLRCQLANVLVMYCRPQNISLKPLSQCLNILLSEMKMSGSNQVVFDRLCSWFCGQEDIEAKVEAILDDFFEKLSCSDDIEQLSTTSASIGLISAILIKKGSFGQTCGQKILASLNKSVEEEDLFLLAKCFSMIACLDELVKRFTCGKVNFFHGLSTDSKIFSLCSFVDSRILPEIGSQVSVDLSMIHILLDGFKLMVEELERLSDEAPMTQKMFIEYLDMLLIRCVHWVEHLHAASGSMAHQLMRMIVPGITFIALSALNSVEFPIKCPIDSKFVHQMLDLGLEKPCGGFDDDLCKTWPQLADSQAEYKWSVVREYAKHVSLVQRSSDELDGMFSSATALLPTSQYKSSVSIIKCLQELLRIFGECKEEDKLVSSTTQLVDGFCSYLNSVEDEKTKWFSVYAVGMIDCLFQSDIAQHPKLHDGPDSPLFKFFIYFLETVGPSRRGLFPYMVMQLYPLLKSNTLIRQAYLSVMPEILMYGPVRNVPEERLADAFN